MDPPPVPRNPPGYEPSPRTMGAIALGVMVSFVVIFGVAYHNWGHTIASNPMPTTSGQGSSDVFIPRQ